MSIEQEVIKLFLRNREIHTKYREYIKDYTYSSDYIRKVIKTLDDYYATYTSAQSVSVPDLRAYFYLKNNKLDEPKAKVFDVLFDSLTEKDEDDDEEVSNLGSEATNELFRRLVERDYATKIANVCFSVEEGTASLETGVPVLLEAYAGDLAPFLVASDSDEVDSYYVKQDLESLLIKVKKDGLTFRLPELQVAVGPINIGDMVVVGARPETGKTTFLASEVTYLASQLPPEKIVVWVNNEERSEKVALRILQAALKQTLSQIESDPKKAEMEYNKIMGVSERIRVVADDSEYGTTKKLEDLFEKESPGLIVFDTLDKVGGFNKEDRDDIRLGKLYAWARKMARKYGPVIASSQADATAENQQYIYQHQLRGSKTDKQGEADVIITIGKIHDPSKESTRWIHIPKNKSQACKDEKYRHGFFEVKIIPERATFEGFLKP